MFLFHIFPLFTVLFNFFIFYQYAINSAMISNKKSVFILDRYPGYDDEISMIWSCFCYKAINNSIPGIQRFTWKITIFIW